MIQWYDTNGRKQNLILLSFDLNGYNVIRGMPYFSFKIFDDNKLPPFYGNKTATGNYMYTRKYIKI